MAEPETIISPHERGFGYVVHGFDELAPNEDSNAVWIEIAPGGSTDPVLIVNPKTELSVKVQRGHALLEVTNIFDQPEDESGEPRRIELDPNSWPVSLRYGDAYRWINLHPTLGLVLLDTARPAFREGHEQNLTVSPDVILTEQASSSSVPGIVDSLNIPMKSTNAAIIDWEIARGSYNKDTGQEQMFLFMNNFANNLPGGSSREVVEKLKIGEQWFTHEHPDSLPAATRERYSDRVLDSENKETLDTFFAAVDVAIEREIEEGTITREGLEKAQAEYRNATQNTGEKQEILARYIEPIYRRLRIMGYSHYDLVR